MVRTLQDRSTGNERIERLRAKALCEPSICIERGLLMTQSYQETVGQPPVIRRAKALEKILTEMAISIGDEEIIVGKATTKQRGAPLLPELDWEWYLDEMDSISTREYDKFTPLTGDEKKKMMEFLPFWKGESLSDRWRATLPENSEELYRTIGAPVSAPFHGLHISHNSVDYAKVLSSGLEGVRQEVREELEKLDPTNMETLEKSLFLRSANISLGASISFARRYAALALKLAEAESDVQRKKELKKIAEVCEQVPAGPARGFHEALQAVWFTYIALMIEGWGSGMTFGRADQYLYPYYKTDIEERRITRDEARDLIALFSIKVHELVTVFDSKAVQDSAGLPMQLNIILGGVNEEGKDAVNELSYLFLDADELVGFSSPDIVIRVSDKNPEEFLLRACTALKNLKGKYKFVSDTTIIKQLTGIGKPLEFARDFIVAGCWAPTVPGRSFDHPGSMLNLPLMLELALNDGASRLTGEQIGPRTGNPRNFKSYDELWDAYKKQVEAQIPTLIFFRNADRKIFGEFSPYPLQSSLLEGCIKKGLDMANGGTAPYISQALDAPGAPNVGDSLAAVKKMVFEEKKITMDQLLDALDKNFEGRQEILYLLESAPKFGNDDDYVDSIVNKILTHFSGEVAKYPGIAGAVATTAASVITANVPLGKGVGALPDGKKAGAPLSEGGLSPYQGRNISGPTATMRSIAKLDHLKIANGSVLNMRFHPDTLKDDSKIKKFASLIRTYCETGGYLVQFNIISTDILRDAQKHPEKYRDLLIRVATYSAYFVELPPSVQDDIIFRAEFQEI